MADRGDVSQPRAGSYEAGVALPRYDELPRSPSGARSAWELFGRGDSLGRMVSQTPDRVAAAARLVRRGVVFSLNAPVDVMSPPIYGRRVLRHEIVGPSPTGDLDDVVHDFSLQGSSQWDSLAHVSSPEGRYYGDASFEDVRDRHRSTIDHMARRGIAGRGVLLDIEKVIGTAGTDFDPATPRPVTIDELEEARRSAGVQYRPGDVLMLNTGFLRWYVMASPRTRREFAEADEIRAVGLEQTEAMAAYLWDSQAAAVVADNPGVEVCPPDRDPAVRPYGFLHRVIIAELGFSLGELWWLDDVAEDCRNDGCYEMFVTSAPLNVPGGIGSPANALAVK